MHCTAKGWCVFKRLRIPTFDHLVVVLDYLDVEWKLVFVPSPESTAHDQELDECLIGPLVIGANTFEFYAEAPDWSKIPTADLFGVSVLYLTGNYNGREFVRVNYYQNTEYDTDELRESPPQKVLWNRLTRDVLAKPKVLRYSIQWCVTPILHSVSRRILMIFNCLQGRNPYCEYNSGRS